MGSACGQEQTLLFIKIERHTLTQQAGLQARRQARRKIAPHARGADQHDFWPSGANQAGQQLDICFTTVRSEKGRVGEQDTIAAAGECLSREGRDSIAQQNSRHPRAQPAGKLTGAAQYLARDARQRAAARLGDDPDVAIGSGRSLLDRSAEQSLQVVESHVCLHVRCVPYAALVAALVDRASCPVILARTGTPGYKPQSKPAPAHTQVILARTGTPGTMPMLSY